MLSDASKVSDRHRRKNPIKCQRPLSRTLGQKQTHFPAYDLRENTQAANKSGQMYAGSDLPGRPVPNP